LRRVGPTIISSTGSKAAGWQATSTECDLDAGWGAGRGDPALVLDPDGSAISVDVFESEVEIIRLSAESEPYFVGRTPQGVRQVLRRNRRQPPDCGRLTIGRAARDPERLHA
jgi:hypothetical protein